MVVTNIHILPCIIFVLIPSSFIITYSIAVIEGHVEVGFPYISDTGTYAPESCIFSQAMNLIAVLLAVFMYVRYKHIEQHYRDHLSSEFTMILKINKLAVIIGWIGCFGVSIIANFQELYVIIVHMTGAVLAFGCATLYCWMQTFISHYVYPLLNSIFVARLRVLLSLILSGAFLITLVAGIIAHYEFHGKDTTKWNPEDGGFVAHVVSTGAEWILVISFDFFILTFANEMKKISVSSPQVHFVIEDLTLQNADFYSSEDYLQITPETTTRNNYACNSTENKNEKISALTTEAIVH